MEIRTGRDKSPPTPLRRSQTTPLSAIFSPSHQPSKKSNLRKGETHDSGYSSPGTPEIVPAREPSYSSTKYRYIGGDDDDEDGEVKPRIMKIDPDHKRNAHEAREPRSAREREREREREISPRDAQRSSRTSHARESPRATLGRSHTYVEQPSVLSPRPTMGRSETSSSRAGVKPLFGEMRSPSELRGPPGGAKDVYEVQYSPKLKPSDIIYSDSRRGGSGENSARDHRDAYAYEEGRAGRGMAGGRGASYVQGY